MRAWMVTAAVLAVCSAFLAGGCGETNGMAARIYGDHESAVVAGAVTCGNGAEAGVRSHWFEADVPDSGDETLALGGYVAVPVDPNTLGLFGLGGNWAFPLNTKVKAGFFAEWDVEESNLVSGPMVMADLLSDMPLVPSIIYEYTTFGEDLEDAGYRPDHRVYLGGMYPF